MQTKLIGDQLPKGNPNAVGLLNIHMSTEEWRTSVLCLCMQGYKSNGLADAFMAFYKSIWGVKPFNDINVMDPKFVLSCCVAAGFTSDEAQEFLHSAEDKSIKSLLKVVLYTQNPWTLKP